MAALATLAKELHNRKKDGQRQYPRADIAPRPAPQPQPKAPLPPPKGKGGELWQKLKTKAEQEGHRDPEAFADAALRNREKTLEIGEKKHKLSFVPDYQPKAIETAAAKAPTKTATDSKICCARTLEGRPCRFKATCGTFCKKHAPK